MLVDQYVQSTLLAKKKPYMESLNPILFDIYNILENSLKGKKKVTTTKEGVEKMRKKIVELGEKLIFGGEVNDIKIPVDYENTGVIQYNSHLPSGLHQFLEIKNKLPITPVSIITNFQSNYGFFNLYKNKNNIYGLTGTLGTKTSKTLLKDIYNLDFAFIPSFNERKLK